MNTLTGFNTADQIIAALYNVSEFQTYKPGFNTIKINTPTTNILDITNIENSHTGFNILIPPPEINYSVAIIGGIDNSGGSLLIGPHVTKIIIGNKNCITNISGTFNASAINSSAINSSTINTQTINTSGTLTIGELSDIVNLGNEYGTVNVRGELNTTFIDSSGDVLNIGLFSEKIELGNHEKDININGILNAYDTINAYNEIFTPILDNPNGILTIGENTTSIIMGKSAAHVNMSVLNASIINVFGLTIDGSNYITLGTGSMPSLGQLGYILTPTNTFLSSYTINTTYSLVSFTVTNPGVYIFNFYITYSYVSNPIVHITLTGDGSPHDIGNELQCVNNTTSNTGSLSTSIILGVSASLYSVSLFSSQSLTSSSGYFKTIRIG
jgi:hypothetical protein